MNRNKKGVMPDITRVTYKNVKKYDRQQFTAFCTDLYTKPTEGTISPASRRETLLS